MIIKSTKNNDEYKIKGLAKIENEEYREYAINLVSNMSNDALICNFVRLANNPVLLASDKYKTILRMAVAINKYNYLDRFVTIVSNKKLLESIYCINILSGVLKLDDINMIGLINEIIKFTPEEYQDIAFRRLMEVLIMPNSPQKYYLIINLFEEVTRLPKENPKIKSL